MDRTTISWTQSDDGKAGATWNPTKGCSCVSPGCANCYAMRIAGRFSGKGRPFEGLVTIGKNRRAIWNGDGGLDHRALTKPLHWRAGRRVFVDSMSDLFYERFTDDEIAAVYAVMAASQHHTFQLLTKRARRMRGWYQGMLADAMVDGGRYDQEEADRRALCESHGFTIHPTMPATWTNRAVFEHGVKAAPELDKVQERPWLPWPLPNLWLGVSVEDRKHGLPRIDELREIPAAIRFLSIEPLLEDLGEVDFNGIDWVIVGCESGPGARTCDLDWIRSIRDQALNAGKAFFLKQAVRRHDEDGFLVDESTVGIGRGSKQNGHVGMRRGKGAGGRVVELPYLDGVQHKAFPIARAL